MRKGMVLVGARAVTAAVVGNTAVVLAKLAGWGATGRWASRVLGRYRDTRQVEVRGARVSSQAQA